MTDRRVGVGRFKMFRGSDSTSGTGGATGTLIQDSLAPLDGQERLSMRINQRRDISGVTQLSGVQGNPIVDGIRLQRFGKYEIVSRDPIDYSTLTANNNNPADPPVVPPVPDATCCTSLWVNHWSIMKHSETQTLAAEPSLYGCTYYWEIRECNPTTWGCGALSHHPEGSSERGVLYTAPTITAVDCEKETRVRIRVSVLESDGPAKTSGDKDESWKSVDLIAGTDEMTGAAICYYDFDITITGEDCPRTDYCSWGGDIVYTTLEMKFSESQSLSVTPNISGASYSWSVISGKGSVSPATGGSTTFTAGTQNINCLEDPVVGLYCNGLLIDSIIINVTSTSTTKAGEICRMVNKSCTWNPGIGKYDGYAECSGRNVRCRGTEDQVGLVGMYAVGNTCLSSELNAYSKASQYPYGSCHYGGIAGEGKMWDIRTSAMKLAGCCPPQKSYSSTL